MKYRLPMWVALTFLMLFAVLGAATFFLLQNRYQYIDRIANLEGTVAASQAERDQVILNATATAKQQGEDQAAQLVVLNENQQAVEAEATAAAQAVLEKELAELNAAAKMPPTVEIFAPEEGALISVRDVLTLTISASDAVGLISLDVTANGESIGSFSAEDKTLFTINHKWQPTTDGEIVIEALAVNINGVASDPVSVQIMVEDREGAINELVAAVEKDVVALRELEKQSPYTTKLITTAELSETVEEIFLGDVTEEEARLDVVELYAFDFVTLDYDLYGVFSQLLSGGILGYYEPEDDELVVVSDDSIVSPNEQLTLVHEITHALQDSNFGLFDEDEEEALDSDASFARRALAEGDATLLETLYLRGGYFDEAELEALFEEAGSANTVPSSVLNSVPDLIIRQQEFPYLQGTTFVQALFETGGFEAVDAAWANPPLSTEHILHPDSYLEGDVPIAVSLPPLTSTLGAGWQLVAEDVFGEFTLSQYMDQQLSGVDSAESAEGWGGDRYAVYWNEADEEVVMMLRLVWDTAADKNEFEIAFDQYARLRSRTASSGQENGTVCWVSAESLCLATLGARETVVLRAPTLTQISRILRQLR